MGLLSNLGKAGGFIAEKAGKAAIKTADVVSGGVGKVAKKVDKDSLKTVGKAIKNDLKLVAQETMINRNTISDTRVGGALYRTGKTLQRNGHNTIGKVVSGIPSSIQTSPNVVDAAAKNARATLNAASNIGHALFDVGGDNLLGLKAKPLGKMAIAGGMLASGVGAAWNQGNETIQGQGGGMTQRSAPTTPAYAQNAGATGDLVFALNNLRNG